MHEKKCSVQKTLHTRSLTPHSTAFRTAEIPSPPTSSTWSRHEDPSSGWKCHIRRWGAGRETHTQYPTHLRLCGTLCQDTSPGHTCARVRRRQHKISYGLFLFKHHERNCRHQKIIGPGFKVDTGEQTQCACSRPKNKLSKKPDLERGYLTPRCLFSVLDALTRLSQGLMS